MKEIEITRVKSVAERISNIESKISNSKTIQNTDVIKQIEKNSLIPIFSRIDDDMYFEKSGGDITIFEKLKKIRNDVFNTFYTNNIILKMNSLSSENIHNFSDLTILKDNEPIMKKLTMQFINIIFVDINFFNLYDNLLPSIKDDTTRNELLNIRRKFFSLNMGNGDNKISYEEIMKDVNHTIKIKNYLSNTSSDESITQITDIQKRIEKENKNESKPPKIILHILRFLNIFKIVVDNPNIYEEFLTKDSLLVNIIETFIKTTETNIKLFKETLDSIVDTESNKHKTTLIKNLNGYIKSQNEENIITYLKLTNKYPGRDFNRKRFENLSINKDAGLLYFKYNHDIKKYYEKYNDNYTEIGGKSFLGCTKRKEYRRRSFTKKKKYISQGGISGNESVSNTYLFGKFTQVFEPENTNKEISEKIKELYNKAIAGYPVFMIGYGASGAGKTSSLIYFNMGENDDQKDGIIIHLCKRFGAENYNNLTLSIREFYDSYDKTVQCIDGNGECSISDLKFVFNNKNYVLEDSSTIQDKRFHEYRSNRPENKSYIESRGKAPTVYNLEGQSPSNYIKDDITLGELLIYYIDKDRYVKATTNNPNSSRSHSIIYMKLENKQNTKPIYLFVGDFAGVENKFKCDDISTLDKFIQISRNLPDKDTDGNPISPIGYYSSEMGEYTIDPVNKTNETNGGDNDNQLLTTYTDDIIRDIREDKIKTNFDNYFTKDIIQGFEDVFLNVFEKEQDNIQKAYKILNNRSGLITKINELKNSNQSIKDFTTTIDNIDKNIEKTNIEYKNIESWEPIPNESVFNDILLKVFGFNNDNNIEKYYKEMKSYTTRINNPNNKNVDYRNIYNNDMSINGFKNIMFDKSTSLQKISVNGAPFKDRVKEYNVFYTELTNNYNNDIITYIKDKIKKIMLSKSSRFILFYPQKFDNSITITNNNRADIMPLKIIFDINTIKKKILKLYYDKYNKNTPNFLFLGDQSKNSKQNYEYFNNILELETNFIGQVKIANDALILDIKMTTGYDKYKGELDSLSIKYDNLTAYIEKVHKVLTYIQTICNNRVIEGKYINNSLKLIRNTIRNVMIEKNADKIYYSPDYIDSCLNKYCPTGMNCFKIDSNDNTNSIPSPIFKYIYELLQKDKNGEEYNIQQFYKEIIISIFCVFNISMDANNPPPVRYIDINILKTTFEKMTTQDDTKNELSKILNLVKMNIESETDSKNDLGNAIVIINEIIAVLTNDITNKIYYLTQYMKKLIEEIDNYNAATVIGTLDFIDQIAKLNTVDNSCYNFDYENNKQGFESIQTAIKPKQQRI